MDVRSFNPGADAFLDYRGSSDSLAVDVTGELESHNHHCLMITSCLHPKSQVKLTVPPVIPRVEDGLSDSEEEPKRKLDIKEMGLWKEADLRNHIMPWTRNPQMDCRLAQDAELCSQSKSGQTWKEFLEGDLEAEIEHMMEEDFGTSTLERSLKNSGTLRSNLNLQAQKNGQLQILEDLLKIPTLSTRSNTKSPRRATTHHGLISPQSIWGNKLTNTKEALKYHDQAKDLEAPIEELLSSTISQSDFDDCPGLENNILVDMRADNSVVEGVMKGNLPPLDRKKIKKFRKYSKEGFLEIISKKRKSKLKEVCSDTFVDTNGVVLNRHGPFWPMGFGPLYSTPRHIVNCPENEALWQTPEQVSDRTAMELGDAEAQGKPLRYKCLVFNSMRNTKEPVPHSVPDDWPPSLVFESRYESGNLHKAWRVGQCEYELVLATDLFSKRHTQWYYFRIEKALVDVTYKFKIINLLKRNSLYNYGMKPLVYSEKDAKERGIGWFRSGHHITYKPWNKKSFYNLLPSTEYYCLEFQIEFSNKNDLYYLAHCYPYSYTDLKAHLDEITNDQNHLEHFRKEVLCETRAGNSCFLLTITDSANEENVEGKLGVVLTARVHPGETQSSWMMKGIVDFLISEETIAKELRQRCVFKIVPMLNPDGVIVGNYRCSLSAKDLNRNYRHPKQELFPTVCHTKKMIEEFQNDHYVLLYCDLHGHSRKPNAFMYGCSQVGHMDPSGAVDYLRQRIFPWLISQRDPDMFDWNSCKFHIHKCKESTGRVVMHRQLGLSDSFTLEASFSGAVNEHCTVHHFNIQDYMSIGEKFCKGIMDYISLAENTLKLNEVILNLTYSIKLQVKKQRGKSAPVLFRDDRSSPKEDERQKDGEVDGEDDSSSRPIQSGSGEGRFKLNSPAAEDNLEKQPKHHQVKNFLQLEDKLLQESLQRCCSLLDQMNVSEGVLESETSEDSNSEVESEVTFYPKTIRKKKVQRCYKIKSVLPTLSIRQIGKDKAKQINRIDLKTNAPFVNRYANRSNGGIPMFAEERLLEREANSKRTGEMKNAETVKQLNFPLVGKNEHSSQIPVINQAFFFHPGRKAHWGLKEDSIEKREKESSQCRSNYRNTDATVELEDDLPGNSSKSNRIITNNESIHKTSLPSRPSPFIVRLKMKVSSNAIYKDRAPKFRYFPLT